MAGQSCSRHVLAPRLATTQGVTLAELLVVIAIISFLLAISVGGLFRNRSANKLLATEQMLTDFIRQAIHTAKSTGAPVVLNITPNNTSDPTLGWTVAGVSRACIWSDDFDDTAGGTRTLPVITPVTAPTNMPPMNGITIGMNGNGMTGISSSLQETATLSHAQQLVRGSRQDGFYLACAVRLVGDQVLPAIAKLKQNQQNSGGGQLLSIPLMLIGSAGDDQVSESLGGMMLVQVLRKEQPAPQAAPANAPTPPAPIPPAPALNSPPPQPYLNNFELIGWTAPYEPSGVPPPEAADEVSSIQEDSHPLMTDPNKVLNQIPTLRDQPPLHPSFPATGSDLDVASPIGVDQWIEVGLLFDGTTLTLYRNGRRVGERPYTGPPNSLPPNKDTIFVGQATVPGAGQVFSGAYAVFDDVRLYRIGTDQLGQLPSGVVAAQPYRITVQPDGQVEMMTNVIAQVGVRGTGGLTVETPMKTTETISVQPRLAMIFSLQPHGEPHHAPGTLNAAVISITASGTVTSSMATWEGDPTSATNIEYPVLVTP